ncbi:MAG: dihydrolipoamide acetyltransferase [Gammaproteobacteria bacterium]|nr:dihydrolipoamide acetyltransferase [Gammaproteobacteria bacterium]
MANIVDIVIPDLGDFESIEVIEMLVDEGDTVECEDGLIVVETDKASMDIPSPENGIVNSLTVKVGDNVSTGDVIGTLKIDTSENPLADDDSNSNSISASKPKELEVNDKNEEQSLVVPDLGDFDEVDVIEVHIKVGDKVEIEDSLATLETDKATMDIPATVAGKIKSVLVKVGDKISQGFVLGTIDAVISAKVEVSGNKKVASEVNDGPSNITPSQKIDPTSVKVPQRQTQSLPAIDESTFSKAHASPSVRKLGRELGVNLIQVTGSGPKNRILHDDVKSFVKAILTGQINHLESAGLPKIPKVDFSKFGEIEVKPLTRIQKISGPRLQASWINLPHVTQHDLADITDLEKIRQKMKAKTKDQGISLTPLAFIIKASVSALMEFPKVNSSLSEDGESLTFKNYFHLGFAADTPQGLVVPVIRDVNQKDVYQIAKELGELSSLAREGKLKAPQLQGASFTVSSLGGIGGTAFTPIVNAPEVAILGVSKSSIQPIWNGSEFEPRLMLPLSFSYDHRVIDGAQAVRFTTYLGKVLADVDALLRVS